MTEEDFCRHMLYTSTLTNKKKEKMLARVSKRFKGKVIRRILIRVSNKGSRNFYNHGESGKISSRGAGNVTLAIYI